MILPEETPGAEDCCFPCFKFGYMTVETNILISCQGQIFSTVTVHTLQGGQERTAMNPHFRSLQAPMRVSRSRCLNPMILQTMGSVGICFL